MRCIAAALMAVMSCTVTQAQALPAFEAASIKPGSADDPEHSYHFMKGELVIHNESLRELIGLAFHVKDYALNGPSWMDSVTFTIIAKPPFGSDTKLFPLMLQNLLAERFHLKAHHETKSVKGYALVVAKGGFKLQPVEPGDGGTSFGRDGLKGRKISVSQLAGQLADVLSCPVQDVTGIDGVYDYHLEYSQRDDDLTHPPLPSALMEQLGLRLEVRTVPVDGLVVDAVDRVPIEN